MTLHAHATNTNVDYGITRTNDNERHDTAAVMALIDGKATETAAPVTRVVALVATAAATTPNGRFGESWWL